MKNLSKMLLPAKTLDIKGFKEQLEFINENVKSLVLFPEYPADEMTIAGVGDVFFTTVTAFKTNKNFSQERLNIYTELRQREYLKLKSKIASLPDYKDKLDYLMNFSSFDINRKWLPYNDLLPNGDFPKERIDLIPVTNKEKEVYNSLIRHYVDFGKDGYTNQENWPWKRVYFDSKKQLLDKQISLSVNPVDVINTQLEKIEKKYNYPEYEISFMVGSAAPNLNYIWSDENVFNYLALGNEINYQYYAYPVSTHHQILVIEEEVKFYKYLLGLKNVPSNAVTNPEQPIESFQIPIAAWALYHVYISKFGGQSISQQNKDSLAKKYGYNSGDNLRNKYLNFQDDDKRKSLHTENKKSATTHLDRFKFILPLLEKQSKEAYEFAKNEFDLLENIYKKHY